MWSEGRGPVWVRAEVRRAGERGGGQLGLGGLRGGAWGPAEAWPGCERVMMTDLDGGVGLGRSPVCDAHTNEAKRRERKDDQPLPLVSSSTRPPPSSSPLPLRPAQPPLLRSSKQD